MKFLDLHVKRYGHFSDVDFRFPGDGLQLIVGPNEAGKTTLLEFVRELLFGFHERTPYDFGTGRVEGAATLRQADGRTVELQRHKGRKNTVKLKIDGEQTDHDADGFNKLLGGATANLFRSVFAFGLKELAEADASLGHESVRAALYAGGLANVVNPKRLLDALKSDADKLFKKGGQNPVVNALCSELGSLTRQVKESSVRYETYEQHRDSYKQAQEQAAKLGEELARLGREHSLTKKLVLALPVWHELNGLRQEREAVTAPEGFPRDGRQQFENVVAEIERLSEERSILTGEIEQDQQELDRVEVDPGLLQSKADIEHVQQLIKSVADARRDIPLRQAEMANTRRQVRNELAELVPEWSLGDLEAFRIDASTRASLNKLASEGRELDDEERDLQSRGKALRGNLQEVGADLESLGEKEDVSVLAGLLDGLAEYTSNANELTRVRGEQVKTAGNIASLLPRLNPPLTSPNADAHALPAPPRETIAQFKRDFGARQQRVHTAQQSLAEEEANLVSLEKELAALHGSGEAMPTRDTLARLRGRRDAGWGLIRRKYVAGEDPGAALEAWLDGSSRMLPDVYEELVRESDDQADALFDKSSAVAKQEQIEATRRVLESKRQTLKEAKADAAALSQRWEALWRPCGFVPLAPDAMEAWLDHQGRLAHLVQQREELSAQVKTLEEWIASYEARLRGALGVSKGDLPTLLAAARSRVDGARKKEQERLNLERSQRRLREQEKALLEETRRRLERTQAWQECWQALLRQLRLPVGWEPEATQSFLERLRTARVQLDNVPGLEQRIAGMQARLDEFDPIVRQLCETVAPDLLNKPTEVAAATLQERLTPAVAAEERRTALERSLAAKRIKLRDLERRLTEARQKRQRLLDRAGAAHDEGFRETAERAERIFTLDAAIVTKARELNRIRENEESESFAEHLRESDWQLLSERLRELEMTLQAKGEEKELTDRQVGACKNALEQFEEGSSEAARLQEQAEAKRAELAERVNRYVPLVFARHLLQKAIERFEHESQPEMLKEVTRIFKSMTAGRYLRVERPLDDDSPLLVYREDDEALDPSKLSTGTREQLYLAIRLAYVLQYCKRAEPLPIVMDDVLANFDDDRARQTFQALGEVARRVQVIMFTCHPHLAELARSVLPKLKPLSIQPAPAVAEYSLTTYQTITQRSL